MKQTSALNGPFSIIADMDTPVSAYTKLAPLKPRYLLESVEGGLRLARYSFLGFGKASEIRISPERTLVNGETLPAPQSATELLNLLRSLRDKAPALKPHLPEVPFDGGLVGYSGYDLVKLFESSLESETKGEADYAAYAICESMLVFDHLTRRIALLHAGSAAEREALELQVRALLRGPLPGHSMPANLGEAAPSMSEAEFAERVAAAQSAILAGDVYQLVASIRFSGHFDGDSFAAYRALRLLNPSPYMFYCEFGDLRIAGSSPEALVRLNGQTANLRPIAGTRPRGKTRAEDLDHESSLLADPKELAEHVMLVDLARNDLGRVAVPGTVEVSPYMKIERYSHVMHIVSGVSATLTDSADCFDVFRSAFPAGTLVGAPKISAMKKIAQLEPVERGLYAGTVGYFAANGDMDQAITIRTLVFDGETYSFQAGAGIVADSNPATEFQEVQHKSAILRQALELAARGL